MAGEKEVNTNLLKLMYFISFHSNTNSVLRFHYIFKNY